MRISDWSSDVCSSDLYLPNSPNPDWSGSQANNPGDALVAAQRVGAEVARMDSAWFAPAVKVPGENRARPLFIERSLPGSIIVTQARHRYVKNAAVYAVVGSSSITNNGPGYPANPPSTLS